MAITLPYVFTNGNVADANQVNANFIALNQAIDTGGSSGGIDQIDVTSPITGGGSGATVSIGIDPSPTFTAPTGQSPGTTDNSTRLATTAWTRTHVGDAIAGLSGGGAVSNVTADAPLSGGGTGNVTIGLETVTPPSSGSFTNANITVDAYGRVIVAASGTGGMTPTEVANAIATAIAALTIPTMAELDQRYVRIGG